MKKEKRKKFIIVNPVAGSGRKRNRILSELNKQLHSSQFLYDLVETKKPKDAKKIAEAIDPNIYDTIVAAGGDGTINEILNGIAGKKITLGILPIGTVNVLAKELGIPLQLSKAIDVLKNKNIKIIDVAKADSHYFTLMAGIGFDAYTIFKVDLGLKKFFGGLAYIFSGIHSFLKYPPKRISLTLDGNIKEDGFFVLVSNSAFYGGTYKLNPNAKLDDGYLNIAVFKERKTINLFRSMGDVLLFKHPQFSDVRFYKAKKAFISSEFNVLAHADAELIGTLPLNFEIVPKFLKVLVP